MPAKNSVKVYLKDGIYHIYNRGVEKRDIFLDNSDFQVFSNFLKQALLPLPDPLDLVQDISFKGSTFKGVPRQPKNFFNKIELLAYSLMPNHFHFLIRQNYEKGIKDFMHSVTTRYSLYFNKKYKRVGALFQGIYKAIIVENESYLLYLTRYIHRNPLEYKKEIINAHSSYGDYLGVRKSEWIKPEMVLSFFNNGGSGIKDIQLLKNTNTYKEFVENIEEDSNILEGLLIEDTL